MSSIVRFIDISDHYFTNKTQFGIRILLTKKAFRSDFY